MTKQIKKTEQLTGDDAYSLPDDVIEALSIDNLVFSSDQGILKILLVKHRSGISKGKWGLPGGWIRYDENLRDAAYRLLRDLTGVEDLYLEQLKAFGQVDRFPAARVVTIAYYALIRLDKYSVVAGEDTDGARWFDIKDVPSLIYDHQEILAHGISELKHKVRHEPIGFSLLPEKFSLYQLQEIYEAILGIKLDKPNFRRKMAKMNLLVSCNEKQVGVSHRAANLYCFDKQVYKSLMDQGFSFEV